MRPAFLMCVRNKVGYVRQSAKRLLEQDTSWPLKVVFSDHWSDDGTYELLRDMAESYDGPHDVEVMRCPLTDRTGILGLNTHLDWAIRRIDADVIFFSSADDVQYPKRVERVMEVFAEFPDAEYVATCCRYLAPDGTEQKVPLLADRIAARHEMGVQGSGWIDLKTEVVNQIGFKTGGAWTRDLWLRCAPMRGIEAPDLILPALAAVAGKMFLHNEVLHDSLFVPDPQGVSIERAMQAAENTDDFLPLVEVNQYQFCSSHFSLMRRLTEMQILLEADVTNAIMAKIVHAANQWVQWRDRLTMQRVRPAQMRV